MNRKTLIVVVLLAIAAVGGFLFHKDYSYRQEHGRVVAVNLLQNYEQEVEAVQGTKAVLIYFYKQERNAPADEAQLDVVEQFAWDNAYDVKVVKVNVAHLENFPLMLAHGAVRTPSFVFLYHDKRVSGQSGAAADNKELKRLYGLVLNQP